MNININLVNFHSYVDNMNEHVRTFSGSNFAYNKHGFIAVLIYC